MSKKYLPILLVSTFLILLNSSNEERETGVEVPIEETKQVSHPFKKAKIASRKIAQAPKVEEEEEIEEEEMAEWNEEIDWDQYRKELDKKYYIGNKKIQIGYESYAVSKKLVTVPESIFKPNMGKVVSKMNGHVIINPSSDEIKDSFPPAVLNENTLSPEYPSGQIIVKIHRQATQQILSAMQNRGLTLLAEHPLIDTYFFKPTFASDLFKVASEVQNMSGVIDAKPEIIGSEAIPF